MGVYRSIRHLLFRLSPELAHDLTISALRPLPSPNRLASHHPSLRTTVAGIDFPSPVGLAAGFDKNAKAAGRMLRLGFGFVEIGTVTPRPQPGNERPRMFRLEADGAVINSFGFNSDGFDAVERRLARRQGKPGIIGVNIGANRDSEERIVDYEEGVRRLGRYADYLTINVSSPNTRGLRDLQTGEQLSALVGRVLKVRAGTNGPPLFLKVSPDLDDQQIAAICRVLLREGIEGLIVGNTTIARPAELRSANAAKPGGLSGRPLRPIALRALRAFRSELGSRIPLIGVGGIASADDAYERIRAGASLIQLYTALAYDGPGLVATISDGLVALLARDGFASAAEAVGADDSPSYCEKAA